MNTQTQPRMFGTITAAEWEAKGNEFDPEIQLIWNTGDQPENRYYNDLIHYYHKSFVAVHLSHLTDTIVSLEIQFDKSRYGLENPQEMQKRLKRDFTETGNLKGKIREYWQNDAHVIVPGT